MTNIGVIETNQSCVNVVSTKRLSLRAQCLASDVDACDDADEIRSTLGHCQSPDEQDPVGISSDKREEVTTKNLEYS